MLNLKNAVLLASFLTVAGCGAEYIPHKTYEVKTTNGDIIQLSCPTLDPARNSLTYVYERDCYVREN